jgi:hypothetical protein
LLLEGWLEKMTNYGRKYYYHPATRKTQWTKPDRHNPNLNPKKVEKKEDEKKVELSLKLVDKTTSDEIKKTKILN